MIAESVDLATIRTWLEEVPDPEIPVLSVVDLGIVRDLAWCEIEGEHTLRVTLTTTYTGCPATRTIRRDIERALTERGIEKLTIVVALSPPWTTDWISQAGREKLRAYGISPPERGTSPIACPRCASLDVEETSRFGSTPCKSLYRCTACREPFDHFKCH